MIERVCVELPAVGIAAVTDVAFGAGRNVRAMFAAGDGAIMALTALSWCAGDLPVDMTPFACDLPVYAGECETCLVVVESASGDALCDSGSGE